MQYPELQSLLMQALTLNPSLAIYIYPQHGIYLTTLSGWNVPDVHESVSVLVKGEQRSCTILLLLTHTNTSIHDLRDKQPNEEQLTCMA